MLLTKTLILVSPTHSPSMLSPFPFQLPSPFTPYQFVTKSFLTPEVKKSSLGGGEKLNSKRSWMGNKYHSHWERLQGTAFPTIERWGNGSELPIECTKRRRGTQCVGFYRQDLLAIEGTFISHPEGVIYRSPLINKIGRPLVGVALLKYY